jgi:hypothetical protein
MDVTNYHHLTFFKSRLCFTFEQTKNKSPMKTIIKTVLVAFMLLTSLNVATANFNANQVEQKLEVTSSDVLDYLKSKGYRNAKILYQTDEGHYMCSSDYDYLTIVFVEGGSIVGMEDID